MSDSTEYIFKQLKNARETQGLSQRELSALSGVPQSYISKVESGDVDIRVSSLVQLALILELKLVLVARRNLPALNALQLSYPAETADRDARQAKKVLTRLKNDLSKLAAEHPKIRESAQLQRIVRELFHYQISADDIRLLKSAANAVNSYQSDSSKIEELRSALADLQNLRRSLAYIAALASDEPDSRPAYALDPDDIE